MTRINVVPVEELCDKHLLAEYRELPRVFTLARSCPDAPKEYVLGTGHVKFFYDKLQYLIDRFYQLVIELEKRGFKPQYQEPYYTTIDPALHNDYIPTPEAIALNRTRIAERISQFKRRIK